MSSSPSPLPPPESHTLPGRWRLPLILVSAGLLALLSIALGAWLGYQSGLRAIGASKGDISRMKQENVTYRKQVETQRHTLSTALQERDIATTTSTTLRQKLEASQRDLDNTRRQVETYQEQLMTEGGLPLRINSLDIRPMDRGAFSYHINLLYLSTSGTPLSGRTAIRLGRGDELLEVPMSSAQFSVQGMTEQTGSWRMPSGFNPEFIQIMVESNDGRQKDVRRFAWERGAPVEEAPNLPDYDPVVDGTTNPDEASSQTDSKTSDKSKTR